MAGVSKREAVATQTGGLLYVRVPGFVRDFFELFGEWHTKASTPGTEPTLSLFKSIWGSRKFQQIYFARFKKLEEGDWLRTLFCSAFAYLCVNDLTTQIGAVYCLYLLHHTQPHRPRLSFPLSLSLFETLMQLLYASLESKGIDATPDAYRMTRELDVPEDVSLVVKSLLEEKRFYFSLAVEVIPPPTFWPLDTKADASDVAFQKEDTLYWTLNHAQMSELEHNYSLSRAVDLYNIEPLADELRTIVASHSRVGRRRQQTNKEDGTAEYESGAQASYDVEQSLTTMLQQNSLALNRGHEQSEFNESPQLAQQGQISTWGFPS
eukprot:TRINITY_DN9005_c0_g1_i1.p1 TRINITY_DN9005_c0_g1~~TRINITY_DN9005_c0_g1_i1.p1  ORF type:complete len:322 (+),score=46.43 TRINITY_DN9005_c0_g1_i1:104-1069(+)